MRQGRRVEPLSLSAREKMVSHREKIRSDSGGHLATYRSWEVPVIMARRTYVKHVRKISFDLLDCIVLTPCLLC